MKPLRSLPLAVPVVLVLLLAAGALGSTVADELAQAPAYVAWLLPLVRVCRDLLGALVLGGVVVGGLLTGVPARAVLRRTGVFAWAWLAVLVSQALLTLSEVLGTSPAQVLDFTVMRSFFTQTDLGRVFVVQMVAAVLCGLLAPAILGRGTAWVVTVIAAVGLGIPALVGHGGLAGGHTAATISLALHVLAVGLWIGGLAAVCQLAFVDSAAFKRVLPRFSALALGCVVIVAETGLVNASLRITTPAALLSSWYGQLVLAKTVLLAWLVLLGWRQRVNMSATDDPRRSVLRLAAWEFAVMAVAVACSVVLARLGPPAAIPVTDGVLPLTAILLLLAVPSLLQQIRPRRVRVYPEIAAVAAVVVCILALDVGFFAGSPAGSLLAAVSLLLAGWMFIASLPAERAGRVPGLAIVAVAWPVIIWFGPPASSLSQLLAFLVGELLLLWLYVASVPAREPAAEEGRYVAVD